MHLVIIKIINGLNDTGIVLCMRPANKRRRYIVKSSLIGRAINKMIPDDSCRPTGNQQGTKAQVKYSKRNKSYAIAADVHHLS